MENLWIFHVGSWKIYGFFMLVHGKSMDFSCWFCNFFMEKPWRKYGDFVEDP